MIEAVKASRFSVAIDYLVLGKEPAPGVPPIRVVVPADKTTLSAPKLKRNWEVRPGYGVDGAFCAFTGEGLATFDATFEFWSPEKEVRWKGFAGVYLATPAKSQTLSIYHPVLMMPPLRITSVTVSPCLMSGSALTAWGATTAPAASARRNCLPSRFSGTVS